MGSYITECALRLTKLFSTSIFQDSASKSYAFEYSVQDELGITHSRKETSDEYGLVRGVYEVIEPNCAIRRLEFQADKRNGFQILGITNRSCQEQGQRKNLKFNPTVAPTLGFIPPPPKEGKT